MIHPIRGNPVLFSARNSVVHETAHGTSGLECSSLSGTWTRGLERGSSRQECAQNAPRGSNLESSRLVDPCPSRLELPRESTPLVDPSSAKKISLHVYDTLLPEGSGMVSDPYTF